MKEATIECPMMGQVIPLEELEVGAWYAGQGRFIGDLGLWTGKVFKGMDFSCGFWGDTEANYGENGFDPMLRVHIQQRIGN